MPSPSKSGSVGERRVTLNFSDSIDLTGRHVDWSPKGVSLLTKWPFREGTEMEFAFDHGGLKHCCVGVVVSCHPLAEPAGHFETVLFFVETPCSELQKAATDCRLAGEREQESIPLPGARRRTAGAKSGG